MKSTSIAEPVTAAEIASAGKYLTFQLAEESYGIPVLKVREIIRLVDITPVPQTPAYVQGVINLRGKIIPVVNLRARFGLAAAETTERTCIVVAQLAMPSGALSLIGYIVDGVEEVVAIAATDIEETPDFGPALATECIVGMAKVNGGVKCLIDLETLICAEGAQSLDAALS